MLKLRSIGNDDFKPAVPYGICHAVRYRRVCDVLSKWAASRSTSTRPSRRAISRLSICLGSN
jgi:hypothetical protein